jgi:hypothetical protein
MSLPSQNQATQFLSSLVARAVPTKGNVSLPSSHNFPLQIVLLPPFTFSELTLLPGITSLPSPSPNMNLVALTIARGTMTFNCTDSSPSTLPFDTDQTTELYDVAPLIQYFPSEDTLHQLIPQFYKYDYAQLQNSSLICIGSICKEHDGPAVVELSGFQTFEVTAKVELNAANSSDGQWVQSVSGDGAWEVYRVETIGGALPEGCEGQVQVTGSVAYAAEYWFYHS